MSKVQFGASLAGKTAGVIFARIERQIGRPAGRPTLISDFEKKLGQG
jgi:hypothetical protein